MRTLQVVPRAGALALAVASCFSPGAQANPTGPTVANGQVSILRNSNLLQITNSPSSIINWQSFSIGAGEITRFIQQSGASAVLNRVTTQTPSSILGTLQSNGRVFLVNPSGIVFGPGSQVNVGGLVASSLNLSDADFLGGRLNFTLTLGAGAVLNQGSIDTAKGGNVYLIGPAVTNSGIITSPKGEVVLAAGNSVQLVDPGTPNLRVEVTAPDNQATNLGQIVADSGRVGIYAGLIDHSGTIRADSAEATADGRIVLKATKSVTLESSSVLSTTGAKAGEIRVLANEEVRIAGQLDASAPNGGNGGFIETSAAHVKIDTGTKVTTRAPNGQAGTWLIDPTDFTIASDRTGTVTAGSPSGDISGATLGTALGSGNVTILSSQGSNASGNGDINVNDAVSWSANTLTLTAARNININAVMTASGASTLALNPATTNGADSAVTTGTVRAGFKADGSFAGRVDFGTRSGTGLLTINGNGYTVINNLGAQGSTTGNDLQGISGNLTGFYALGSNIDAAATSTWNSGAGFLPLGDNTTPFTGAFDGLGHTITGLAINSSNPNTGLFGLLTGAVIRNVGLVNASVTGTTYVGGLLGSATLSGAITNSYSTGANVTGSGWYVGGLAGAIGTTGVFTITNSYNTGNVTSPGYYVGGLAGFTQGTVTNSYSAGSVTGNGGGSGWYVGGLAGVNANGGTISNSYSTAAVTSSSNYTGGLVGWNNSLSTIANSYSTGSVSGTWYVGGLVGRNDAGAAISNTYCAGAVTGSGALGGLVGANGGTVTNSYWDTQTSGLATSSGVGATGLTTTQMKQQASFTGFDFTNTWTINEGASYPTLRAFAAPLSPLAFIWDNGDGNYLWTDPLNWTFKSGLPGNLDSVTLNLTGGGQVQLTTGNHSIASIVSTANNNLLLNGGSLTVSGTANLAGNTTLQSGSSLTLQGASTLANYTQSGGTLSNAAATSVATMNWTGGTITGTGSLTVTSALNMPAGIGLNVWNRTYLDGTTLNANGTTTFGSAQNNGGNGAELNLSNGATVNNNGAWSVDYANINGPQTTAFNNLGTLTTGTAYGGTITSAFNNSGAVNINVDGITLTGSGTSSGIFNIASGATLTLASGSAQTLSGTLSGAGSLEIDGTASASGNLTNAGTIRGTGTLTLNGGTGTLTNNSHLAPGTATATGTLTINGNVMFGAGSSLDVRLGAAGGDQLAVSGTATLDGTLNAALTTNPPFASYTPNGESFQVLTYGTRSGSFATLGLPTNFQNTYNASNLTLTHTVANGEFWTNTVGDFLWTTAGNWSLSRIPVSTDDVTLNVSGGSEARVTSGTNTIATLTSTANNSLLINGGSLTVLGSANLAGNVSVKLGVLTLQGTSTIANFTQNGGGLEGTGDLTLTGISTLRGGTFSGTGKLINDTTGVLTLGDSNSNATVGGTRPVVNKGTASALWGLLTDFHLFGGLTNEATGTFNIAGPIALGGHGFSSSTITNAGILNVHGIVSSTIVNTGTVTLNGINQGMGLTNKAGGTVQGTGTASAQKSSTITAEAGSFLTGDLALDQSSLGIDTTGSKLSNLKLSSASVTLGAAGGYIADTVTVADTLSTPSSITITAGAATTNAAKSVDLSSSGVLHVNDAATIASVNSSRGTSSSVALDGTGDLTLTGTSTLARLISGTGKLINDTTGVLTLGDSNSNATVGGTRPVVNKGTASALWGLLTDFHLFGGLTNEATGTFNIAGPITSGTVDLGFAGSTITNAGTLNARGIVSATITNTGTVTLSGVNEDLRLTNHGTLNGTGTVGATGPWTSLFSDGTIAPGGSGSIGTLTFVGNVSFGSTGRLALEMDSTVSYDKLLINGSADLGGTISLVKTNTAYLADGVTMTPLTYTSHTGTFAAASVPTQYSVDYLSDRMNVSTPNLVQLFNSSVLPAANQAAAGAMAVVELLSAPGSGASTSGATTGSASGGTAAADSPGQPGCPAKARKFSC